MLYEFCTFCLFLSYADMLKSIHIWSNFCGFNCLILLITLFELKVQKYFYVTNVKVILDVIIFSVTYHKITFSDCDISDILSNRLSSFHILFKCRCWKSYEPHCFDLWVSHVCRILLKKKEGTLRYVEMEWIQIIIHSWMQDIALRFLYCNALFWSSTSEISTNS